MRESVSSPGAETVEKTDWWSGGPVSSSQRSGEERRGLTVTPDGRRGVQDQG